MIHLLIPALLTVSPAGAAPCDGASLDGDLRWAGFKHDSFEETYRSPFGARPAGSGDVTLRVRACAGDAEGVRLRLWDEVQDDETWHDLTRAWDETDPDQGPVSFWELKLALPDTPRRLFYYFELRDGAAVDYYQDDDVELYSGGSGEPVAETDTLHSYQISVWDGTAHWPDWMQGALVYQILPDRFRNGDPSNDPADSWLYGYPAVSLDWNQGLDAVPQCVGDDTERAVCFYGGDLQGIVDKLDHLAGLGVDVLYLNPIFTAPTNHRYDPQDFFSVDPDLGDLSTFQALASACDARGIRIVLDGVFNHVSADSVYFDHFARWAADGSLTSPDGPGVNDGSGACEAESSPWRDAFYFDPSEQEARYLDGSLARCPYGDPDGATYQGWAGYYHIPKLDATSSEVRDLVWAAGPGSAGPYWILQGSAGWRLDVAPEVDGGVGAPNDNDFWEGFRAANRAEYDDAVIVGEHWGDATQGLLGTEWDSVMNYRFSTALLDWMFDGCSGDGCTACVERNCSGQAFSDEQHHAGRETGEFNAISEGLLRARLLGILEDYPPPVWTRAWNLLDSHDTNRVGWILRRISNDDESLARRKLTFLFLFQTAWPGSATLYYGDEVGVQADAHWDGVSWKADPWNRVAFPWADEGLVPDLDLYDTLAATSALRDTLPALRSGDLQVLDWDDDARTFTFLRDADEEGRVLAVFNRRWEGAEATRSVTVDVQGALEDGGCWQDALSGQQVVVRGGKLTLDVPDLGAALLAPADCGDTAPPGDTEEPEEEDSSEDTSEDTPAPGDSGGPKTGCGCATGASPRGGLLALLLLVMGRRGRTGARRCASGTYPIPRR